MLAAKLREAFGPSNAHDHAGAARLCGEILRQAPRNPQALHLLGLVRLMSGDASEAASLVNRALETSPRDVVMLENLGLAHLAAQDYARAESAFRKALALGASHGLLYMRLGLALGSQGRLAEAVDALRTAAGNAPADPDVHLNLGNALAESGQTEQAAASYRRVLTLQPDHVNAYFNLGTLFMRVGRLDDAAAAYRSALAHAPDHAEAHNNLGLVYEQQARTDDAIACFRRALELNPGQRQSHNNLGRALRLQGRREEALTHYRRALELDPNQADGCNELGSALRECGKLVEAEACYRKAIALEPNQPHAHYNLAEILKLQGRLDEAAALDQQALALQSDFYPALGALIHLHQHMCDWDGIEELWQRLKHEAIGKIGAGVSPFSLLSQPTSADEQLACARAWAARELAPLAATRSRLGFDFSDRRRASRKLRIGYLSWDFHQHATSYLIAELFEIHDRDRFEIHAYSYGPDDGSAIRARIGRACDRFTDVADQSYAAAAQAIYSDEVDVLVDLKGYTQGSRSQIMALRPAPVQVSWLGYPGTMGTDCIDYMIADPFIIPAGMERCYSEQVVRLPDCYQINDRRREISGRRLTREECGLPARGMVFCCFNLAYKILPDVFARWMRIMQAVPDSVLWLLDANPWASRNLRRAAAAQGVAPERLVFAPRQPLAEHLARYRLTDLALDTFPYTSHTTASDSLWAGCPLVTCSGETFASRVAGSILINAGMPELVTASFEEYEQRVLDLAASPTQLGDLRRRLEENRDTCPLFDTPRFTRNLERAYEQMVAAVRGYGPE